MKICFCIWCVKCAKYLAFGTFERADDSALILLCLSIILFNLGFLFYFLPKIVLKVKVLRYVFEVM